MHSGAGCWETQSSQSLEGLFLPLADLFCQGVPDTFPGKIARFAWHGLGFSPLDNPSQVTVEWQQASLCREQREAGEPANIRSGGELRVYCFVPVWKLC